MKPIIPECYPRVDIPQIRDLGFIIADGLGFWSEVKRVANYDMRFLAPGVPAFEITHQHDRYPTPRRLMYLHPPTSFISDRLLLRSRF